MTTVVLPNLNQTGTNSWSDVEDNDKAIRDVVNGNLDNTNVASNAGIAPSKLANATAGYILIANASGVITATQMTGDATINSSGVISLATDSVGSAEIAAGAVGTAEFGSIPAARGVAGGGAPTSCANATDVAILLPTENYDTDSIHSTVTNTSRMTAATAGRYVITAEASTTSGSTWSASVKLRVNGSTVIANNYQGTIGNTESIQVSTQYALAATDYVELVVNQQTGATISCYGNVAITWLAP